MKILTLEEFYRNTMSHLPEGLGKEIGHFNVFRVKDLPAKTSSKPSMLYNRRAYYKISLINSSRVDYGDRTITVSRNGLLFGSPKVPYKYSTLSHLQDGYFCIFTKDFLSGSRGGVVLDDLPIFRPGACPVFELVPGQVKELRHIFEKMRTELRSDYTYKYDLLRTYVLELIHFGQKLHPGISVDKSINASGRIAAAFIELLELQFPIESQEQVLRFRTANDFADHLSIHVNHLNKILKEVTGKTTTDLIGDRIVQEAKILLKQSDWSISQISACLGFREVAHFSNFFRRKVTLTPLRFRSENPLKFANT